MSTPVVTVATPVTTTLHYRRAHPGGGPLGRCSYGIPGVPGIVVFDLGMFVGGIAPATITLPFAMAAPAPRKVAGVTSAVVAAGNAAVAVSTGTAIATPAIVATVAAPAAVAALATAATPATPATPATAHKAGIMAAAMAAAPRLRKGGSKA